MRKHPLRKFSGLLVLYAVVIIGIFVIQFKTQSLISQSINDLSVTIYQKEDENHNLSLTGRFRAEYKGLVFYADEETSVEAVSPFGGKRPLSLVAWEKTDSGFKMEFTGGTVLVLTADKKAENGIKFSIDALFGDNVNSIFVPYRLNENATPDSSTRNRISLFAKDGLFALYAGEFVDSKMHLSKTEPRAYFTSYNPVQKFTFDQITGFPGTDAETYEANVKLLRQESLSKLQSVLSSSQSDVVSENEMAVYVAEMASVNKFNEALDSVPSSFRRGTKRTYFTAPYFASLVEMDETLVMQNDNIMSMVDNAISTRNADIFSMDGITDFILREKKTQRVKNLLTMPGYISDFSPNLVQAGAILKVYAQLSVSAKEQAALLEPLLSRCIEEIEDNCSLKDDSFTLSFNGNKAGTLLYAEIGSALLAGAPVLNRSDLAEAGRLLINTALVEVQQFDWRTLSQLYPLIVTDNRFYPHQQILGYYGSRPVWVWTCADVSGYTMDEEGTVSINIDFPLGLTNYLIFKGVPTFHAKIEMQGIMFRTDPRFETYNSSGYVYKAETGTLFIKSRHKSQKELVRLFCDPVTSFSFN